MITARDIKMLDWAIGMANEARHWVRSDEELKLHADKVQAARTARTALAKVRHMRQEKSNAQ